MVMRALVQAVMQALGSDGERWGAADEAFLTHLPLTSCCVARFLIGCGLVPVQGLGVEDSAIKHLQRLKAL